MKFEPGERREPELKPVSTREALFTLAVIVFCAGILCAADWWIR